jgi:hypothetical protein
LSVRVDVLLDLDGEDFGLGHLRVEELHDPPQLPRDSVGDEHEP